MNKQAYKPKHHKADTQRSRKFVGIQIEANILIKTIRRKVES